MMRLQLVLPCYNEAKSIPALIERAAQAAEFAGMHAGNFNLLLVENGSRDNSLEVMEKLKATSIGQWFEIVKVPVNKGYGYGLKQGLLQASAEFVAWSHADQQCDPGDVFKALAVVNKNDEMILVKGSRRGRSFGERAVTYVFEILARLILGVRVREINAQPKLFSKKFVHLINSAPDDFAFDLYALYQAQKHAYKIKEIPVIFPPRVHGISNWAGSVFSRYKTIKNMIKYMLRLSFSEGRL